ncbi:hypothetical protein CC79DRAFT_1373487 [Sarocladium strictum]
MADQADRQWQSQPTSDGSRGQCVKAKCKPWMAYAQTSTRLKFALKGHDAVNIPDEGICSPDCATFVCCLPFYGLFIAKLQSTVRAFYDIDGSDRGDCLNGCCCPCFTLVRAENEILTRESKNYDSKDTEDPKSTSSPSEDTYIPQPPMEVVAPVPSQVNGPPRGRSSSASSSSKGKDTDRSSKSLSTIPEVSREVSGAGNTGEDGPSRPGKKVVKAHGLEDDFMVTVPLSKPTLPSIKFMDKQWFLVPAKDLKENAKPDSPIVEITEDMPIELKKTDRGVWGFFRRNKPAKDAEVSAKHILADDTRSRATTISLKHALAEDPPAPKSHGGRFAEHLLENDHASPSLTPWIGVSHELSDDPVFTLPDASGKHVLTEEEPSLIEGLSADATQAVTSEEQANDGSEAPPNSQDETEPVAQDKGFVATFFRGIARSGQGSPSPAAAETPDSGETPVAPLSEEVGKADGHDSPDRDAIAG